MASSPKNGTDVVLYLRVSTEEQAQKDLSIPAQRRALQQWAADRDYNLIAEYVEPGASARDDNRPQFRRMIGELLEGKVAAKAILVVHTSRFMRNVEAAFVYRKKLEKEGVRVISITQETDDGPSGRLMEAIFASFDAYESDMNAYRTTMAMSENARRGFYNGRVPPFGFRRVRRPDGKNERVVLEPEPEEVDTVAHIFRLYLGGKGGKAVAREFNRSGVHYRRGRSWTKDLVLNVIDEEAVVGTYYWGKRDGNTGKMRDRGEWTPMACPAIIDRDLFDLAQETRRLRDSEKSPGRTPSSPLLLAGLVRCGRCDAAYTLETSGKLNFEGIYDHRYYNCRRFLREGRETCPGGRLRTDVLDRLVLDHLADKIFTTERCKALIEMLVEEAGSFRKKVDDQRSGLRNQLRSTETALARWQAAFEAGEHIDVVAPRLRELQTKRLEMTATLTGLSDLAPPPKQLASEKTIRRFQETIRDIFISNDTTVTKSYLRFLVDRIIVHEGRIEIRAKPEHAAAMMAAGEGDGPAKGVVNHPEAVLAKGGRWLPTPAATQTAS